MLEARRRELTATMHGRIRDVRRRDAQERQPSGDEGEPSFGHQDMDLALVQMQAEAVSRIEAALRRLDEGRYGRCAECEEDIAHARLVAMPFAVRCTECEGAREARTRQAHGRGRPSSAFEGARSDD